MKLSFVTPRYGNEIVGGAEHAVAMLAENILKYSDIQVEVLSTTAGDERTWSKKYQEGKDIVNGVDVQRFYNEPINRTSFDSWASQLLSRAHNVSEVEFDQWLIRQGPYSPGLLEAISNSSSDAIVFHPMLSSPTSHGVFRTNKPVIIHPALHEEPLSYMPGYKKVINRANLLAFSTYSEQALSHKIHFSELIHQSVIGFGVDTPDDIDKQSLDKFQSMYGLKDKNYAVVIGRVDQAKGSTLLCEMFNAGQQYISGIDTLVFVGPVSPSTTIEGENIVLTGSIEDEAKWALLSGARCLISPSWTESFSLVVLEAMKLGVPVIVNGMCEPTKEHVVRSNSGAYFTDFSEFCTSLDLCTIDSPLRDEMILRGKMYVDDFFDWESLIARYIEVISNCVSFSTSS